MSGTKHEMKSCCYQRTTRLQITTINLKIITADVTRLDPPLEPTGDLLRAPDRITVPSASDLDIADWRVEVRRL
jgi:hypothetical protein